MKNKLKLRFASYHLAFVLAMSSLSLNAQTFNEILGRPTDSGITMNILFDQKVDVYWEYGTSSGNYSDQTANYTAESNITLEVDFTKLLPNTRYFYRTRYRASGSGASFKTSTEHTFQTQRAKESTFSFTVESDEHLYDKKGVKSIYQICLNNQASDKPDFMFSLGDTFGDDHIASTITSSQMDILHKNYRPFLGSICHSVPFFFCLGNHEGEFDYYMAQNPPNNMAVYGTIWRKFYYPNPYPNGFYTGNTASELFGMGNPENYYAWTWGDALFVVLDVYRYQNPNSAKPQKWDWTIGKTQYDWFRNTLVNSKAKYKFVFAHHTRGEGRGGALTAKYYEWGGYEADGTTWGFSKNRPGWEKPIHQLMVDNGVNIFFQGHDHLFAKEELDGLVYQEVPMPSDSTYEIGVLANSDAYVSNQVAGTGHLRVTVSPSNVKVDFVRAWLPADVVSGQHKNGEVAFSYMVNSRMTTGLTPISNENKFLIYPNPANNQLTIGRSDETRPFLVQLYTIQGQKVIESTEKQIDVARLVNGIYLAKVTTESTEFSRRIIINH